MTYAVSEAPDHPYAFMQFDPELHGLLTIVASADKIAWIYQLARLYAALSIATVTLHKYVLGSFFVRWGIFVNCTCRHICELSLPAYL